MKRIKSFNKIITLLNNFWKKHGCVLVQPIDQEVGAATFHPTTFVNAITSTPWNVAYTQISKRPSDIRHSSSSNRSAIFHQYQVIMKPSPNNIQNLYLESLNLIGINTKKNEIKFVEDNWQSPSLGASGIGWEVRLNGIEVTQFTYFQQMGNVECFPVMVEIAYGLERITMHAQKITNIDNIIFDIIKSKKIRYSDIFQQYEKNLNFYLSKELNIDYLIDDFAKLEKNCESLLEKDLPLIAYDNVIKLSHIFNLIDSKTFIAFTERQNYILKIKNLANKIANKIANKTTKKIKHDYK